MNAAPVGTARPQYVRDSPERCSLYPGRVTGERNVLPCSREQSLGDRKARVEVGTTASEPGRRVHCRVTTKEEDPGQ